MTKPLAEMSLAELWALFPIVLVPHDDRWAAWYEEERAALTRLLPPDARVHHIGSTAVPSIMAKPIVDILVETDAPDEAARAIAACGFRQMYAHPTRRGFNKGYTEAGFAERVFHLHLAAPGDCPELYFRDWLRAHPADARDYEALKLRLWKRYEHDRDGYTDAKSEMVAALTRRAMAEYAGRYDREAAQ